MLLFMLYCLAWFVRDHRMRLALLSGLTFLLIFTGFGLFVGLLTPLLLLVEGAQALRACEWRRTWWIGGALVVIGVAWVVFAHGYYFAPAVDGFRFPYEKPWEYAWFVGLMLANLYGVPGSGPWAIACGLAVAVTLASLCGWHSWRLLRRGVAKEPRSAVIFSLAAFALTYCANTAVGRVCLGLEGGAPASSRYLTLMIPAGLAIFLHIATLSVPRRAQGLGLAYAGLLLFGTLYLQRGDRDTIRWYSDGRRAWKAAYLATHDAVQATRQANFPIHPFPDTLTERLQFLEKHRLNLFKPDGQP